MQVWVTLGSKGGALSHLAWEGMKGDRCSRSVTLVSERENRPVVWRLCHRDRLERQSSSDSSGSDLQSRWRQSRFQTGWEKSRCWGFHTRSGGEDLKRTRSPLRITFCLESSGWFAGFCVVPGGRRTQVPPWMLCLSELQGGDWGQRYLCFGWAVQTLLVSHLEFFLAIFFLYLN